MLRVYCCFTGEEPPTVSEERLSAYRRSRLEGLRHPVLRRQALFAELLLVYALRDSGFPAEPPLAIETGEFGKPFLADGCCRFSLSHAREAVVCALCDGEVGADVEYRREANEALTRRFFHADERSCVLRSFDPADTFTEIWTKKESYSKCSGKGLGLGLESFSVLDRALAPRFAHRTLGEYHICAYAEAAQPERAEWIVVDRAVLAL